MQAQHTHAAKGDRYGLSLRYAALAVAVLAIVLVAAFYRAPMLPYYGFYEPDGFFHYSVIREAVANNFVIPQYLDISGWPPSCNNYPPCGTAASSLHHEAFGIYWVTLIPYYFLRYAGIGYYTIMRLAPVFFALLEMLLAFILMRYKDRDRFLGLLVVVLIALNVGNAARNSALIYRGDSFAPAFLLGAMILTALMFRAERPGPKIAYAALAGFALSLCNLVWNGGPFGVAVYIFAFALMLFFAFVFDDKKLVRNLGYMLASFAAWFLFVTLYTMPVWIVPETLTGWSFAALFVPMILAWLIAHYLLAMKHGLPQAIGTGMRRAAASLITFAIIATAFAAAMPGLVGSLFTAGGYFITGGSASGASAFSTTIQELQPPTYAFLFSSFNLQLFATPMTLVMLLATQAAGLSIGFWIIIILLSFLYLFLQVDRQDGDRGMLSGTASFRFELNPAMLLVISFFSVMAFLQMNAIRFNALLSIPLSMLAAYTIYWLVLYVKGHAHAYDSRYLIVLIPAIMATLATFVAFPSMPVELDALLLAVGAAMVGSFLASSIVSLVAGSSRARLLGYAFGVALLLIAIKGMMGLSALVILGIIAASAVEGLALFKLAPRIKRWNPALVIALVAVAVLLISMAWIDVNSIYTYNPGTGTWAVSLTQADGINTYFLAALSWMKNNTPGNATVLTLWPDGSVVEGVANRTAVTDSVGSQNAYKGDAFAAWLLNDSTDPGFLLRNITGMPQYLLVRYFWLSYESGGIYTESKLNASLAPYYGVSQFSSVNETSNRSSDLYRFSGAGNGVDSELLVSSVNNTTRYGSWLVLGNGSTSPYAYTAIYNLYNSNFTLVKQATTNSSNAATFLLTYFQSPGSGANLTAAYMMNPDIAYSNMAKLLYLCGPGTCLWDNNVATLRLIYTNRDTKIFKIQYNMSNATVASDYALYYG